jgi:hypothetical protein
MTWSRVRAAQTASAGHGCNFIDWPPLAATNLPFRSIAWKESSGARAQSQPASDDDVDFLGARE